MTDKNQAIEQDIEILREFTALYCRENHNCGAGILPASPQLAEDAQARRLHHNDSLCPACRATLEYAIERRRKCPMDPKPKCKDCQVHCYRPQQRQAIREIMKFGGMHYIKHARLDKLVKLVFKR